jgi:hypothetical protein
MSNPTDDARAWAVLTETAGAGQAEILQGLLEAQEITVFLSQEGLSSGYALSVGRIGTVQVLVPSDQLARARAVLHEIDAGGFDTPTDAPTDTAEPEN